MLLKCLSKDSGFDKKEQKGGGFRKKYKFLLFIHGFPHKSARIWTLVLKFLNLFDDHFLVEYYDVGIHGHFSSGQFDLPTGFSRNYLQIRYNFIIQANSFSYRVGGSKF